MSVSEKYRREMEEWQARLDARSREIRMLDEELAIAEGKPLGFYSRALEYAMPLPLPPRMPASLVAARQLTDRRVESERHVDWARVERHPLLSRLIDWLLR